MISVREVKLLQGVRKLVLELQSAPLWQHTAAQLFGFRMKVRC